MGTNPSIQSRPGPHGWPWDDLLRHVERWGEADRRHHAARVAGDTRTAFAAEWDRAEALGDWQSLRADVGLLVLLGLRVLTVTHAPAVDDLLTRLPAVLGLRADVDELASAVAALEGRRAGRRS